MNHPSNAHEVPLVMIAAVRCHYCGIKIKSEQSVHTFAKAAVSERRHVCPACRMERTRELAANGWEEHGNWQRTDGKKK